MNVVSRWLRVGLELLARPRGDAHELLVLLLLASQLLAASRLELEASEHDKSWSVSVLLALLVACLLLLLMKLLLLLLFASLLLVVSVARLVASKREREPASGQPDTLRCELRFLFLWPDPLHPGVGQRSTLSWLTTTLAGARSRRGQPDKLRWCA